MGIPPAQLNPFHSRAHFLRQMDLTLSELANHGVSAEVRLTPERATVYLASSSGQVVVKAADESFGGGVGDTVPMAPEPKPAKAKSNAAGQVFWSSFKSSFKKNLTTANITAGVICLTMPKVAIVDLAVSVFGLLVCLIGRLIGNRKMKWAGYDLAVDGVLSPFLDRVYETLFPKR